MKTHKIKLNEEFCDAVYNSEKKFEVRLNDRGYQKGDRVVFTPVSNANLPYLHPIETAEYEITYVLSGWGIKEGYVVFGIEEVSE